MEKSEKSKCKVKKEFLIDGKKKAIAGSIVELENGKSLDVMIEYGFVELTEE